MLVKDITYYVQGRLSENEAITLWKELITSAESFEMLETFLYLKVIWDETH